MRLKRLFPLGAVMMLLGALASCSGGRQAILDTIPADVKAVAVIDTKGLAAAGGITLTADGAVLDPVLENRITSRSRAALDRLARIESGSAALDRLTVVLTEDMETYATFNISSYESFVKDMEGDLAAGDDEEGMHTGTLFGNTAYVANDTQVWITDSRTSAAKGVKDMLDAASKHSISSLSGLTEALSKDALMTLVMAEDTDEDDPQHGIWLTGCLTAPDNKIVVNTVRMQADGAEVATKGVQPINPAVLAYVKESPAVAIGAGITSDFDWTPLTTVAMLTRNFQTQAMISAAMPYLKAIDGTVFLAATPAGERAYSDPQPGNWNILIMAHMPQDKVNELLGAIRGLCFTAGITPSVDPRTGMITVSYFGFDLYMGNVDGYFALSNTPISADGNNDLAPKFVNRDAAAVVSLPSLSPLGPGLPAWGLNIEVATAGPEGVMEMTLPGSKGSVLLNLLSMGL